VDAHSLTPLFLVALVIWGMYRRVRRSFGPQPIRPRALKIRAGVFILLAVLILIFIPRTPALLGSLLGGMAAGVVLGYIGLRHTRFEITERGKVFIPHTYIGLFVTSLLFVRLAMRYISMNMDPVQSMQPQSPWGGYQRNPLTLAMFGLVVGYYVFYNIGVFRRSREPALPAGEPSSP
jgi:hypothetical protein